MRTAAHCLWLTIASLTLAACGKPEARPKRRARCVMWWPVKPPNSRGDSYAGEIRARHETNLAFRVAGKVVAKLANSGDRVKKGQVLARLDPSDYALDLSAKQAQLAAAQSDLGQQELNLKRYRELLAKQFVSQSQVDGQQNAVNAARAKVDQAKAQLAASRNQTGYTNLVADADGVLSQMVAEPGWSWPLARRWRGYRRMARAKPRSKCRRTRWTRCVTPGSSRSGYGTAARR